MNMPLNSGVLIYPLIEFLICHSSSSLQSWNIKACEFLTVSKDPSTPAPVLVKFLYLRDKDIKWLNKKLVAGYRNLNKKEVSVYQRATAPKNKNIQKKCPLI